MAIKTATFLTPLRVKELQKELDYLRDKKEPQIAKSIKDARELGNTENSSEYDVYLEEQSVVVARIREIEETLAKTKVIKNKKTGTNSSVVVGATVIVEVEGRQDMFTIVGVEEAAPHKGKISHESPVGKSLIGCTIGQEVLVETEMYSTIYKIIDVK